MKKYCLLIIMFTLQSLTLFAQLEETENIRKSFQTENKDTVAWIYTGFVNLGANQGFLHNWNAGGEVASLTLNALSSSSLVRQFHHHVWSNNLDLAYGLFYAYSNSFVPRKTDDRLDFTSKYSMRVNNKSDFFLTGLFNFKSQFTKGYDYNAERWDTFSTSKFFSPAYFTLAVGMEYRKGEALSLFASPFAARYIVAEKYYTTQSEEGAFGIEYGKTSRFQLGAYFSGRYQVKITENMLFKTRLDLYSDYLAKDVKDSTGMIVKKDNPGNIDILSDNLFSYKISKLVYLTLAATFIYDNDIPYSKYFTDEQGNTRLKVEPGNDLGWLQIKQIFTLGLEYKF